MLINNVTTDYKLDGGVLRVEFLTHNNDLFKINLFAFDKTYNILGAYTLDNRDTDIIFKKIKSVLSMHYTYKDYYDPWVAVDVTHRIKNNWPFKIY